MAMSQRLKIALDYLKRHEAGETYQQLLDYHNETYGAKRTRGFIFGLLRSARNHVMDSKIIQIPQAQVVVRHENLVSEQGEFNQQVDKILHDNRFVRVMHMNDMHLPYHDERAVELFLKLAYAFQPHVNVMGSDAFDNPTISRYPSDKDISVDDWLIQSETYWKPIVDATNNVIPNALKPFIQGNHDRRSLQEIGESSYPRVGFQKLHEIVTYGGVKWLGKTECVKIGALNVIHGKRFNKHTAASTSDDFKNEAVNAGHTHRPQMVNSCVINGMLCQKEQFYDDNGYPSPHQHGTTLITIDMLTGKVVQVPYLFAESNNQLWTVYNSQPMLSKRIEYTRQGRKAEVA